MSQPDSSAATVANGTGRMEELERAAQLADKVQQTLGMLAQFTGEAELIEAAHDFTAIRSHSTGTDDGEWDGPANETNVRSPESEGYFADVYAWRDDEADTSVKAAYRFIHHFVADNGEAGAASTVACSTGIGVLNGGRGGTTIPEADRQGVYEHLARHLRDADREPPALMSQDDYEAALLEVNERLADEEFTAIQSHSTSASDDAWNGPENEVRVSSPNSQDYFELIYGWRDETADPKYKESYRFVHHFVGVDGRPGAASIKACANGIGVLNGARGGTVMSERDRRGVYNHLARHLRDADRTVPELMAQDAYELALEEANLDLAIELDAEGSDLAGLSESDLIAELARRWAADLLKSMSEIEAEFDHGEGPLVKVEINEAEEDDDEGEGKYPEGAECCPVCDGMGEVDMNGMMTQCPECGGAGYILEGNDIPIPNPGSGMEVDVMDGAEITTDGLASFDWEGVLIVEGIPSGDGRMIAEGALTWRELPIPLMLQTVNAAGHDGAVIAGSIHEIVREGQNIVGRGFFDSGDAGQEAMRLLSEGTMRGVSADIDSVVVDFVTPEGDAVSGEELMFGGLEALEVLTTGRIMGATLTPFPAFQEAFVAVLPSDEAPNDEVLIASGGAVGVAGDVWRVPSPIGAWVAGESDAEVALASLVASAGNTVEVPANPPQSWFLPGEMSEPVPFAVHADGRCYGLVAEWGTCHIGFTDRCVSVPRTGAAYKHFRNKTVLTAEGELVATGPIFMDTVHPNLRLVASDTQAFYADTGCAVADVALYENEFGIVAAGALRPGLTPEQVRRFRGSDVSPDWRTINGRLEVVGLLSVNVSGFIVEGLVASGGALSAPRGVWDSVNQEVTALVAAGMVRHEESELAAVRRQLATLESEVIELREALRPWRAERAAATLATLTAHLPAIESCGCGGNMVCSCESTD